MHDLSLYAFELPAVEEWITGDNRLLAFQVTDDAENPVDISNADIEWALYERPYEDNPSTAVATGEDADVVIVDDARVDTTNGEFEVRVEGTITEDLAGEYWQRPSVTQPDNTTATWRGKIILTA